MTYSEIYALRIQQLCFKNNITIYYQAHYNKLIFHL